MRKSWNHWTDRELARLRELRGRGLSIQECARALGRTYWSVQARAVEDGLRKPAAAPALAQLGAET